MSIYVDHLQNLGWKLGPSCHMIADSVPELIAFARTIGLRPEWFQPKSSPHFDLTAGKRIQAVAMGAIELDRRAFVAKIRELRQNTVVALYCDGGLILSNPSPVGGTFAWCGVNARNERVVTHSAVWPVKTYPITNNMTELLAIVNALLAMPAGWRGTVYSDSDCSLGRVFRSNRLNNVPAALAERMQRAIRHVDLPSCEYVLLQGHPTRADLAAGISKRKNLPVSEHNVWCDKACTAEGKAYMDKVYSELAEKEGVASCTALK